jgi:hypothetical protein
MNVFEMLQNRMNDNEIIYVTCEEMEFIVFDIPQDRPPNPPIKYKREKESYGFFRLLLLWTIMLPNICVKWKSGVRDKK